MCEMTSKSVQPVFPFLHVGALRHATIRPLSRAGTDDSARCNLPLRESIGPFGCNAGNRFTDIPQEELTCLYQGEPIGENS